MRPIVVAIGLLVGLAVFATAGTAGRGHMATVGEDCVLTPQEMAHMFGKCPDCVLGQDELVEECLTSEACPACKDSNLCISADYAAGNYVYNCKSSGITDGHCYQNGLVDCKQTYSCEPIGSWYPSRHCAETGYCETPASGHGCVRCQKGEALPLSKMEQQMDYFCACP